MHLSLALVRLGRYLVRLDVIAQSYHSDDCPSRESESSEGSTGSDGDGYNHVRGGEKLSASEQQRRRRKKLKRSAEAAQKLSPVPSCLDKDRHVFVKKPPRGFRSAH